MEFVKKTCPFGAISIYKGIYAQVNLDKCVGCSISLTQNNKAYCNIYCRRGQLLEIIGAKFSRNKPIPKFLKIK
ncbi:hypothetical protein ACTFIN_00205 [Clostridium cagae]|uniref:hypothetical protein n=1 Tax=Clostridium cagae TaxID=2080751 RepID=UPI003F758628